MTNGSRVFESGHDEQAERSGLTRWSNWIAMPDTRWRKAVLDTQLPHAVKEKIVDVLASAKLTASERKSVARELVAHFEDGHSDGFDFEKLLANFGDSQVVASLIQRAKIRNRTMLSTFIRVFAVSIALFLAGVGVMWGVIKMRKPSPSVNYLTQLMQPVVDTDESEKAWPLYRGPWIDARFCDTSQSRNFVEVDNKHIPFREVFPGDPGWDQVVQSLDDHFELLEAFRAGSRLSILGLELQFRPEDYGQLDQQALFPSYYDRVVSGEIKPVIKDPLFEGTGMMGVLLPHHQSFQYATEMFLVDSRLAIADGEIDRVIANIEASFGLARQIADPPLIVSSLTAFALFDDGVSQIEELLSTNSVDMSQQQILNLQNTVSSIDLDKWLSYDGERAAFGDLIQQLFTDDGDGNGKLTWQGLQCLSSIAMEPHKQQLRGTFWSDTKQILGYTMYDRKEIVDAHASQLDLLELHLRKRPFESPLNVKLLPESDNLLIGCFVIDPQPLRGSLQMRIARRDALVLALAIERFRRSTNSLPLLLNKLVPNFIGQIPIDPITGDGIRYRHKDESFTIYSVALDKDDDAGEPVQIPNGDGQFQFDYDAASHSGDWVLWHSKTE